MLTYGSVCSGIEAVTVAWRPLGLSPAWFAEIDPFCSAVLAHHYPEVRNYGDFTKIGPDAGPIDILVGGTPCQSFSIAGRREGLEDHRGNLTLEFLRLAQRLHPRWVVWENVPGVLSIDGGRTFGAVLGTLAELGYGFAYRVLDAQFFGVPQRRRRVFVVGHLGDWRAAAAVLFEPESLRRNSPARQKARSCVAAPSAHGIGVCGTDDNSARAGHLIAYGDGNTSGPVDVATTLTHHGVRQDFDSETFIAHTLRTCHASEDGTGRITLIPSPCAVRRLTPRECERLQGFPDDYTLIQYRRRLAADRSRYRAIGNSMAVPVMRWIGERLKRVEGLKWE